MIIFLSNDVSLLHVEYILHCIHPILMNSPSGETCTIQDKLPSNYILLLLECMLYFYYEFGETHLPVIAFFTFLFLIFLWLLD